MPDSIDSFELAHLTDIRSWRANLADQLAGFEERVRTYQAQLHDADVMERGHLAFLHRKYGAAAINDDGTLVGVPTPPAVPSAPIEAPAVEPAAVEPPASVEAPPTVYVYPPAPPIDEPTPIVAPEASDPKEPTAVGGSTT